ncbi:hypothetical protein O6H91_11G027800 [Diphasiastrum complanatum]|uniref:Uncharacterized protein n=1 Tax=Diphasiastrum complanatum TaxID=34168 RepID=A0ACC2C7E2_DIPCM|nr:hypothetical protein O6H91_11G027800 [Diphasiastrum complanatum]
MAGKRQRGIRRTVSVSTMGPGSNMFESSPLPEYPKEKQKAPVLSSHSPHRMLASNNPVKPSLAHADAVSPAQPAAPLQPLPVSHKFEKPPSTLPSSGWDRSERKCVGLGVVAALADESGASTEVKDGKDKAPPPVVSQNTILPHSAQHPSHNMDMQGRSAIFLHESPCSNDYDDLVSMELPAVNFLEFCYLCKRQLCQGRDIYMYRYVFLNDLDVSYQH